MAVGVKCELQNRAYLHQFSFECESQKSALIPTHYNVFILLVGFMLGSAILNNKKSGLRGSDYNLPS